MLDRQHGRPAISFDPGAKPLIGRRCLPGRSLTSELHVLLGTGGPGPASCAIVRRTNGPPADTAARDIGSIASVGFGLTGLCIAAERGWLPRSGSSAGPDDAAILRREEPHERGWFYHFVNLRTGAREWQSELSSIDTALLLAGVLTVRRCFDADPEIVRLRRRDLPAGRFLLDARGQLRSPLARLEAGIRVPPGAMGSLLRADDPLPAGHRVADASDSAGFVARLVAADDARSRATRMSAPPTAVRPSVRARVDRLPRTAEREAPHIDWFENSVTATRAHKAFCLSLARSSPATPTNVWGITASDSRNGYVAWGGPPRHADIDGSVVPAAAAGSLMFAPDITVPAVREMRRRFGDRIYGRYGFADAFHPTDGWVNPDVIGIDLGITLLSAENLRTGHVWSWFMKNPEITTALQKAGVK